MLTEIEKLEAGRETDEIVAREIRGMEPCGAWRDESLGCAGGPCMWLAEGACEHEEGKCYPIFDGTDFTGPPRYSTDRCTAMTLLDDWDGIYELRVSLQGINYRMLYFFHGDTAAVVSHGIVKERVVPPREIDEAIARKRNFVQDPERHTYEGF